MTDSVEIILTYKDRQQTITVKGTVTHIQHDRTATGERTQVFVADVDSSDNYVKQTTRSMKKQTYIAPCPVCKGTTAHIDGRCLECAEHEGTLTEEDKAALDQAVKELKW